LFYRKSGPDWFEQNRDETVVKADANWRTVEARLAPQ
jgi:hypothetical protein